MKDCDLPVRKPFKTQEGKHHYMPIPIIHLYVGKTMS